MSLSGEVRTNKLQHVWRDVELHGTVRTVLVLQQWMALSEDEEYGYWIDVPIEEDE